MLVRLIVQDDARQSRLALKLLEEAASVAISLPCICELAWVLETAYKLRPTRIGAAIRTLYESAGVHTDKAAVEFGLDTLDAGGDFADAVIAYESARLGGETFVTFDKQAARQLSLQGLATKLLS